MEPSKDLLTRQVLEVASMRQKGVSVPKSWFPVPAQDPKYFFDPKPIEGAISWVYFGLKNNSESTGVVLKIVKDQQNNDLAQNEIKVLLNLWSQESAQSKHLPVLIDQFKTDKGLVALVLGEFNGYNLETVRKHSLYQDGVPEEHMVWILSRLLSVLGYTHSQGILHGDIEPAHILIQPDNHNLCLVDWTAAITNPTQTQDRFKIFHSDYSAPEVKEKGFPTPAADLYSAAKCMVYLLGGDVKTNKVPQSVNPEISMFLEYFMLPSPIQRAQDAWHMYAQLQNLRNQIWGDERFRKFKW